MKKLLMVVALITLSGCGAEQITGNFTLSAAQGYVQIDDTETPHTYVIDSQTEEVYVDRYQKGFTDEELAAFDEMSIKEKNEFIANQPVVEEPRYDIQLLDATKGEIILEYEDERIVFTALSESYFKADDGTQYIIEYDSMNIPEYLNSFRVSE